MVVRIKRIQNMLVLKEHSKDQGHGIPYVTYLKAQAPTVYS